MLTLKLLVLNNINNFMKVIFKDNYTCLPYDLTEEILRYIDDTNTGIEENFLLSFTSSKVSLKNITLHCNRITNASSMAFLRSHQIESIYIEHFKKTKVKDWLNFVNDCTLKNLCLRECTFLGDIDHECNDYNIDDIICLSRFKNLIILDVSYTDFHNLHFEYICKYMEYLNNLNISGTNISDLKCIKYIKKLTIFDCSQIRNQSVCQTFNSLKHLKYLQSLDITQSYHSFADNDEFLDLIKTGFWEDLTIFNAFYPVSIERDIVT